jgi:transposase-like protein
MKNFKNAFIKRAWVSPRPGESTNHRNGKSSKTVLTNDGALRVGVPRDR